MLNPIKLKFKKEHKNTFKNKEYSVKKSSLSFGDFGITARSKGVLFYKELEAAKKVVAKAIKGVGIVVLRVRPNRPRTKKKGGCVWEKGRAPSTIGLFKFRRVCCYLSFALPSRKNRSERF